MKTKAPQSKPTIFFQSLGCPKNLVDSEVMLGISLGNGYQVVSTPEQAEIIVVNTCSFIEDSKRESIEAIIELSEHKENGTCKRLIVTGCLPQRYREDLKASLPEVDAFVGTGQYHRIIEFISGKAEDDSDFNHPRYIHSENTPRINSQPSFRAYLKISEGCIKACSFCIIPKIRGALRSRTIPSLVAEASKLANLGVVELNLIAQNLPDYGNDLGDGTSLVGLLKELVKIKPIEWLRLLYVYPDELCDALLLLISKERKICKYLDLPVQHISDRILKSMKRRVTGAQIRDRIGKLRETIPGIYLRSAVMVGYPGETEEEFRELKQFIEETRFDHLGVFSYSREESTDSFDLPDQIDEETKQRRLDEIMALQQGISHEKLKERIGQTTPVLVEKVSEESEHLFQGRHQGQAPDIDGYVLIRGGTVRPGLFVPIKLEQALEYDYVGIAETNTLRPQ